MSARPASKRRDGRELSSSSVMTSSTTKKRRSRRSTHLECAAQAVVMLRAEPTRSPAPERPRGLPLRAGIHGHLARRRPRAGRCRQPGSPSTASAGRQRSPEVGEPSIACAQSLQFSVVDALILWERPLQRGGLRLLATSDWVRFCASMASFSGSQHTFRVAHAVHLIEVVKRWQVSAPRAPRGHGPRRRGARRTTRAAARADVGGPARAGEAPDRRACASACTSACTPERRSTGTSGSRS